MRRRATKKASNTRQKPRKAKREASWVTGRMDTTKTVWLPRGVWCAFPLRTVSELNRREHWTARAKRARVHRASAYAFMAAVITHNTERLRRAARSYGLVIHMVRVGARRMDSDAVPGSCKHVRDGIADWLELDDGDRRLEWTYDQRCGPPSVEVTITIVA